MSDCDHDTQTRSALGLDEGYCPACLKQRIAELEQQLAKAKEQIVSARRALAGLILSLGGRVEIDADPRAPFPRNVEVIEWRDLATGKYVFEVRQ